MKELYCHVYQVYNADKKEQTIWVEFVYYVTGYC